MSDRLEVRTLGGLFISQGKEPVTGLASRKAEALLVYLVYAGRPLPREVLADLLWDDRSQRRALANLRVVLSSLRKQLGEYVAITRATAGLNQQADIWLDAAAFEEGLAAVADEPMDTAAKAARVCAAIELYHGDFLEGWTIRDARNFEAWVVPQQERLHRLAVGALHDLVAFELASGQYQAGRFHANRVLTLDRLDETGHRQLMTLLALHNQRSEALTQYEQCRQLLNDELGVLPSPETEELYELIRQGELPPIPEIGTLHHVRPTRAIGQCPYRGLAPFREVDAPYFYGRERFAEILYQTVQHGQLLTVLVGPSGSGKSSTLQAGLVPRLCADGGWALAGLRPGGHPFHALADALLPHLEPELGEVKQLAQSAELASLLQGEAYALGRLFGHILQKQSGCNRLLVWIDQFEELYTLCPDPDQQHAFIDLILKGVEDGSNRSANVFVLTMRADFMGQALSYRPLADALQETSLLLGPMTEEELRAAIEIPAEKQGAAFEEGLVERILADVGNESGNLPLLEFALTLLWEQNERGWLTHSGYEAIGQVQGALASYAEQVYTGLGTADRERARRALIQLVRPGSGTEDTRRVARREELGEENWELIHYLADKRLVVTDRNAAGDEVAEVIHEALIQRWDRLQEWMESDRAFRAWQEQLRHNLQQWQESREDDGALLVGTPLSIAQEWLVEREEDLSDAEAGYIRDSYSFQQRLRAARERRRRRTLIALVAGLIVTLGLALFAYYERQNSQRQAAILLAGQAEQELADGYHDRAVLLALAALEQFPDTVQAERALGQAVLYNRALQQYTVHESAVTSLAWSPDGTLVASASGSDNTVHVWDPVTAETQLVIDLPVGTTGNIFDMALNVIWTPDGQRLLIMTGDRYRVGSQDFDLLLYDATTGKLLSSVEIANATEPPGGELSQSFVIYPTGLAADIMADGERLATLGGDNTALIWDDEWQEAELVLRGHEGAVNSVEWSPDGTELVTAGMDGTARIWSAETGEQRLLLAEHEGQITGARWSPRNDLIATTGEDGVVNLWETETGDLVRQLEPETESVWSLAWSPDGVRLATGHHDGQLALWDVETGELLQILSGHQGLVSDLVWSPVDDRLASSDNGGSARIWNTAPSTAWRTFPVSYAQGIDWTSDSRFLAVAGGDIIGDAEPPYFAIWDVAAAQAASTGLAADLNYDSGQLLFFSPDDQAILYQGTAGFPDFSGFQSVYALDPWTGEFLRTFTADEDEMIWSFNWSPDGNQVATGTLNHPEIWIWDYENSRIVSILSHPLAESGFQDVAWSPDGTKLAAALAAPGLVPVWEVRTGDLLYTIDDHEPPTEVWSVAWSPDGTKLLTTAGSEEWGAEDTTARIWDGETGTELVALRGHTKSVLTGGWSPNGQRIVTASLDNTIRIWDANGGDELLKVTQPPIVVAAAWSPDGNYLATSGLGPPTSVWRVWQSREELINYAEECCVFRELTALERQQVGLSNH